jgi:hypothetical protein
MYVYNHCNILIYFLQHQYKTFATYIWNIWNTRNIRLQHSVSAQTSPCCFTNGGSSRMEVTGVCSLAARSWAVAHRGRVWGQHKPAVRAGGRWLARGGHRCTRWQREARSTERRVGAARAAMMHRASGPSLQHRKIHDVCGVFGRGGRGGWLISLNLIFEWNWNAFYSRTGYEPVFFCSATTTTTELFRIKLNETNKMNICRFHLF